MHFEILVEDQSGKKALDILVPKIVGEEHTFRVIAYKGIGRIPKDLRHKSDPRKRILLDQLPQLLRGYGRSFPAGYPVAVIVVTDLDDRCLKDFREQLFDVLHRCSPKPATRFCVAIEEGEAWLLGDLEAVQSAYPKAKKDVLQSYANDSVCGTWEKLADAVFPGGAVRMKAQGWQSVGRTKSEWAERIAPFMDPESNRSPSFGYFARKLTELAS